MRRVDDTLATLFIEKLKEADGRKLTFDGGYPYPTDQEHTAYHFKVTIEGEDAYNFFIDGEPT